MNGNIKRTILTLTLGILTILSLSGCSSDRFPLASRETPAANTTYPVLTDEQIENGLIPGFQVLRVDARAYGHDGTLDDQTSRLIRRIPGGTVSHRNNGVQIGGWQLWEDQIVTVSTPNPGYAIVDFYPHPYRFNGSVRVWLDLTYMQLPPGMRWDQLAMFYVDDDGSMQRHWGYVDLKARQYVAWTDHFSRYIVGFPEE
jgi:hypothetical protein